jgi:branched-chain amino acid transport system substrate-binding protein
MTASPGRAARLLVAALLLVSTACGEDVTQPGPHDPIVIGGLFSLTGNWSTLGTTAKAAMELAVEDVNAQLAAGGSALSFKTDIVDTRLDATLALTAAKAMYGRGARVLIGPQSSAEVVALREWANSTGAILVSPSSTAGSLAIANDNILRLTPGDSLEAMALVARLGSDRHGFIVPFWRDDPGNDGLALQTRALGSAIGGVYLDGVEYGPSVTNFAPVLAALHTQVAAAIARAVAEGVEESEASAAVAIAHAGFDEIVDIMKLAANDPLLSSVQWYGTDGTSLSEPLRASPEASAFAASVNFAAPIFGLDPAASERWQPVYNRIKARAGRAPDAFAMAVYDAVWIAANSYMTFAGSVDVLKLRDHMIETAEGFYGTTGWTILNPAGDRLYGNFDFYSIKLNNPTVWSLTGRYDSRTHVYTRISGGPTCCFQ